MVNPVVASAALPPFAQKLLRLIGKLVSSKAHAQITITIRDGKVQLITMQQNFLPDNIPE